VHSAKDVPSELPAGLAIVGVPLFALLLRRNYT